MSTKTFNDENTPLPANNRKGEEDLLLSTKKTHQRLNKAIQSARLAKKMSQKDVAKALDAKPQMIADWETGKAIPSTAAMGKLAQVLGAKLPGPGTPAAEKKLAAEKRIAAAGAKKSGVGKTVLAEKKGTPANARALAFG